MEKKKDNCNFHLRIIIIRLFSIQEKKRHCKFRKKEQPASKTPVPMEFAKQVEQITRAR
jgi:hypothetical protein